MTAALRAEIRERPKAGEHRTAGAHHIAMVLWGPGAQGRAAELRGWAGCDIWLEPGPDGGVCVWATRQALLRARDVDLLAAHLADWRGGAAFGGPDFDSDGFMRSHREALTAYAVARACGDRRLRGDTAQLTILLASDRERSTEYVRRVLGPLGAVKPRQRTQLLATMQVYIEHGHRSGATAHARGCDRDTVGRHLRRICDTLGLEVDTHGAELLAALRLRRLLGVEL